MSGGSHNYICYKIEEELVGRMHDAELDDLMADISELAHSLEWAESGDTSIEDYQQDVVKFKQKWFKADRNERLIGYIEEKIKSTRKELLVLVGGADNENP